MLSNDASSGASPAGHLPVPSRERLARRFAPQFEACERLLHEVWSGRPDGLEPVQPYQAVLLHILGRAISTYRGVLIVCRAGLPTQGLMLCRSLWEDLIAAYWATLPAHREIVLQRVLKQERHMDLLQAKAEAAVSGGLPELDDASDEERRELDTIFGPWGDTSWFEHRAKARREEVRNEIKQLWAERGGDLPTFNFFDRYLKRLANTRLHNTVAGLYEGARGSVRIRDRIYPSYGQGQEVNDNDMRLALLAGSYSVAAVADLAFSEIGFSVDAIRDAEAASRHALFDLMPPRRLGRNDPCWCGSNRS